MSLAILIIDDDEKLNKLLTKILVDFGFQTSSADHPQKRLEAVEAPIR
jgi:DNA-binding response OmpR family regulator